MSKQYRTQGTENIDRVTFSVKAVATGQSLKIWQIWLWHFWFLYLGELFMLESIYWIVYYQTNNICDFCFGVDFDLRAKEWSLVE